MRRWLFEILIRELLKYLQLGRETVANEDDDMFLTQMWESPAFRKRLSTRDAKLIHQMAGGEGFLPEPRDAYLLHAGQRVENLIMGREAKAAWNRTTKKRQDKIALAKEQEAEAS